MSKSRKIYPTVSVISLDILKSYGFKPSEAIEKFALLLVTKDTIIIHKEQLLQDKKNELLDDKKNLENLINNVDNELKNINELKRNYAPTQSKQYDTALHQVTLRLRAIMEAEDKNQWDLKKVSLDEVALICKENNVTVESVLKQVPQSLKRYIEGYTTL